MFSTFSRFQRSITLRAAGGRSSALLCQDGALLGTSRPLAGLPRLAGTGVPLRRNGDGVAPERPPRSTGTAAVFVCLSGHMDILVRCQAWGPVCQIESVINRVEKVENVEWGAVYSSNGRGGSPLPPVLNGPCGSARRNGPQGLRPQPLEELGASPSASRGGL